LSPESLKNNLVFSPRKALQYNPIRSGSTSQGSNTFYAKNPDYGVIFTFYLNDDLLTKKEKRKKAEEKLEKSNSNIPFPGWQELDSEINERSPKIVIEIFDSENKFINRLSADYKKGFNRVSWDLKKEININVKSGSTRNYLPDIRVKPGKYSYNVYIDHNGEVNKIGSKFFEIERIRKGILTNPNEQIIDDYITKIEITYNRYITINHEFNKLKNNSKSLFSLIYKTSNYKSYSSSYSNILSLIQDIDVFVSGNKSKMDIREKDIETISDRLYVAYTDIDNSYGPTALQISSLDKALLLIDKYDQMLKKLNQEFIKLKNQVEGDSGSLILD
jgi:hypothetical protein